MESNLERQETKHFFTDGNFGETNSSRVVKWNKQVLDSRRPSSSQFSSLDISSWDKNERNSSKIDIDVSNLTQPRNSTTSLQSNTLIAITKVRKAEDTSTPSKSKRRTKNKLQSEVKLLPEKSSSLSNDHDFKSKDANDLTKIFNTSRKKKRRKHISWINSAKHHRRKRSHRRIFERKSVDFNKVKTTESERIKSKRSVYPLGIYPQFRGAGKERVLLRFKRKALLENEQEELPRNRKKRKRKRGEKASQRQVKQRSLPRQNIPNVEISGLTKGYSRSVLWRKSAFGRDINGFRATTAVNPQVKYDRQITPGQSLYVVPNSYKVILRPDQYVQRKSLPAMNFAQSNAQVAQNGQIPVAKILYDTKKSAMKSVRPGKFQSIGRVKQAQFEQLAKYHYPNRQPQRPFNSNVVSRNQVIQRPFYVFEPHFSSSQIVLPDRNQQTARLTQPWPVKPQFYGSQQGTRMPEMKSHVPQANDLLKGSPGSQGLIMYLNFEDVEQGKSPFASFYGHLADAGKRTEISRSFGSCGKVARINNGSEILLNGGQIKVMHSVFCFE